MKRGVLFGFLLLLSMQAFAQSVEVDDGDQVAPPMQESPVTGKDKAGQYLKARKPVKPQALARAERRPASDSGAAPRYLALHIGTFFTDQSYRWGDSDQKNVGKLNAGVTYRLGEWVNSMDFAIRLEYTNYTVNDDAARKLSIGTILTFPDANSRFPLYFGGGLGAGMFIKQVNSKSPLALDWQVIGGARFLDVIQNVGFMVEAGLKNHLFLLSDGQFNGVFINVGTVFAF